MERVASTKGFQSNELIAGVDEVGRGPLAGPVVTCAVILGDKPILGLTDSKALTHQKRLLLCEEIKEKALAWSIGRCEIDEIDSLNILQATMLAMHRAVDGLKFKPDMVLVDGNRCPKWPYNSRAIIKGDLHEPCISAASIIAKVTRDLEMEALDKIYPGYGLADHKGYPTKTHIQALEDLGVTPIHRRSYAPVRKILEGIKA